MAGEDKWPKVADGERVAGGKRMDDGGRQLSAGNFSSISSHLSE
jgi:hypothetical protein